MMDIESTTVKKLKAMISQPMAGKTEQEIAETREKAIKELQSHGYEFVNTLFTDDLLKKEALESVLTEHDIVHVQVRFLSKSIEKMAQCHAVYFCTGWVHARGCRIEHHTAAAYGLDLLYETKEGARQ